VIARLARTEAESSGVAGDAPGPRLAVCLALAALLAPGASCSSSVVQPSDGGAHLEGGTHADGASGGPCSWGATTPALPNVGLASVSHTSGPTADEQKVLDAMNRARGGTPIKWSACLADLARGHTRDELQAGYYGHGAKGSPSTYMIYDRATAAGYVYRPQAVAECVLQGNVSVWLSGDLANVVSRHWMSDDHARPILQCTEVGIAVEWQGSDAVFVTADFLCDSDPYL
jgi:uncharacterized protein YkwD